MTLSYLNVIYLNLNGRNSTELVFLFEWSYSKRLFRKEEEEEVQGTEGK